MMLLSFLLQSLAWLLSLVAIIGVKGDMAISTLIRDLCHFHLDGTCRPGQRYVSIVLY